MDNTEQPTSVEMPPELGDPSGIHVQSDSDPVRNRCGECGAQTSEGWDFCDTCGQRLGATSEAVEEDEVAVEARPIPELPVSGAPLSARIGRNSPRVHAQGMHSRARTVAFVFGTLLLLGIAAGLGYIQQQTSAQLGLTKSQLSETSQRLTTRSADLVSARDELFATNSELTSTTSELKSSRRALRQTKRQLTEVQRTLGTTRNQLDLQANQIATLKSCLNGVANALGYAAYSNFGAALAALDAVQVSCDQANDLF